MYVCSLYCLMGIDVCHGFIAIHVVFTVLTGIDVCHGLIAINVVFTVLTGIDICHGLIDSNTCTCHGIV